MVNVANVGCAEKVLTDHEGKEVALMVLGEGILAMVGEDRNELLAEYTTHYYLLSANNNYYLFDWFHVKGDMCLTPKPFFQLSLDGCGTFMHHKQGQMTIHSNMRLNGNATADASSS